MTAIGIDLGTTNSVLSILSEKPPHTPIIIKSPFKKNTTPSVVNLNFDSNNNLKTEVGEEAVKLLTKEPENTIFSVKRLMGKKYNKDFHFPYKVEERLNGDAWIKILKTEIEKKEITEKSFSPSEISSLILKKLKSYAPKEFKKDSTIVITVPAYFNESQRQATKDAGRLAGLKVARVINEPTAAALSYGLGLGKGREGHIAVYDLGGGTFDVTILYVKDGIFEVLATNGDTNLGGDDVDVNLAEIIAYKILKKESKEEFERIKKLKEFAVLKKIAEGAKKQLSENCSTKVIIPKELLQKVRGPNVANHDQEGEFALVQLKKSDARKSALPVAGKTEKICRRALSDSSIEPHNLKEVVLVGGMTRMPLIRETVEKIFGRAPLTDVDPMEAVAKGAAIQAGIIRNMIKDTILLDVNSLSLGIETMGGIFSKIIKRNSPLPARKTETFTTSEDNQETVDINIFQGERPLVEHNSFLGTIKLKGIKKLPKGTPRIDVSFEADNNGMINVSARDKNSGEENKIKIIAKSGLKEGQIRKIIEEAELNRKKDEEEVKKREA